MARTKAFPPLQGSHNPRNQPRRTRPASPNRVQRAGPRRPRSEPPTPSPDPEEILLPDLGIRETPVDYVPSPAEYLRHQELMSDPSLDSLDVYEIICREFPSRRGFQPRDPRERRGFRTMSGEELELERKWKRLGSRDGAKCGGDGGSGEGEVDGADGVDGDDSGNHTEEDQPGKHWGRFGSRNLKLEGEYGVERQRREGTWGPSGSQGDLGERGRARKRMAVAVAASPTVQGVVPQPMATGAGGEGGADAVGSAPARDVVIPPPDARLMQALQGLTSAVRASVAPRAPAQAPGSMPPPPSQIVQRPQHPARFNRGMPHLGSSAGVRAPSGWTPINPGGGPIPRQQLPMAPPPPPSQPKSQNPMTRSDTVMGYSQSQPMMPPGGYTNPYGLALYNRMPGAPSSAPNRVPIPRQLVPASPGNVMYSRQPPSGRGGYGGVPNEMVRSGNRCCGQETCRHRTADASGRM